MGQIRIRKAVLVGDGACRDMMLMRNPEQCAGDIHPSSFGALGIKPGQSGWLIWVPDEPSMKKKS